VNSRHFSADFADKKYASLCAPPRMALHCHVISTVPMRAIARSPPAAAFHFDEISILPLF